MNRLLAALLAALTLLSLAACGAPRAEEPQPEPEPPIAEEVSLDTIMDEHYHLRKEIERYSTVDYNHALRTSQDRKSTRLNSSH